MMVPLMMRMRSTHLGVYAHAHKSRCLVSFAVRVYFFTVLIMVWVCLFPTRGSSLRLFTLKSLKHRQHQHVCNQSVMYHNNCQEMTFCVCHFGQHFPICHVRVHTRWSILEDLHVCQSLQHICKTNNLAWSWNHAQHRFHKQWSFSCVCWFCL